MCLYLQPCMSACITACLPACVCVCVGGSMHALERSRIHVSLRVRVFVFEKNPKYTSWLISDLARRYSVLVACFGTIPNENLLFIPDFVR